MAKRRDSAGLVIFRRKPVLAFLLVHPGGPYWTRKDDGAWSIPKGEFLPGEAPVVAARREFFEETGVAVEGELQALKPLRQPGGKIVHAWALEADVETLHSMCLHAVDPAAIKSGVFEMEWPPRSGRTASFPEVDRACWFDWPQAQMKILVGQRPILERLKARLEGGNQSAA